MVRHRPLVRWRPQEMFADAREAQILEGPAVNKPFLFFSLRELNILYISQLLE